MTMYKFIATTQIEAYSEEQAIHILATDDNVRDDFLSNAKLKNHDPKPRGRKSKGKVISRSKDLISKVQLCCPRHGYQYVYGVKKDNGKEGTGCEKCFKHLEIYN